MKLKLKMRIKLTRKQQNILMLFLLIFGVGILAHPDVAGWYQGLRHDALLQGYAEEVALMEEQQIQYELERAIEHNKALGGIEAIDPFAPGSGSVLSMEYYNILNLSSTMGRIEIPAINVDLPIFHGVESDVLDRGVGHMPHPPFPIGGEGNHSILSAHTGLVNARMFTDLELLDLGDIFIVTVLNNRIAFEVDQIDVVYPHQIEVLQTYPDRDLMTLVTCTPYGINTHRLLVRGSRIPYTPDMTNGVEVILPALNLRMLIILMFSFVFLLISIDYRMRQKRRRLKEA